MSEPNPVENPATLPNHLPAMTNLREIITDFETDNPPLTRHEVDAARARMRHEYGDPGIEDPEL
ncbi:hypothetical protein [Streptomyces acidiscabies]|uniref:hypothetical protein n=1 Tax=Streptomyces acidiscabies TaxID=42234 RepID=UPI0038F612DA